MMEKLSREEVEAIAAEFAGIPEDYLRWLRDVGFGEYDNGYMVYSGPVASEEILADIPEFKNLILVADDMAGYSIGYRPCGDGWQFIGVDSAGSEVDDWDESFSEYMLK